MAAVGVGASAESQKYDIPTLLQDIASTSRPIYACAPMVRYSKLPFRKLVRKYGADLAFTPMIIAKSFSEAPRARDAEFSTDIDDRPLIVQFAANNGPDLAMATEFVLPYSDGVDLNCGCPQKWPMAEGYGSQLIFQPEIVSDMVKNVRRLAPSNSYSVSIKIRVRNDLQESVELCRMAEMAGVDFLTVHGRTPSMRHEPVLRHAFRTIKDSVRVPVLANGDVRSVLDAEVLRQETNVDGVMSARGILHNPGVFAGHPFTPLECVREWVDVSLECGTLFTLFHHHLMFMLERHLTRAEKKIFNRLQSVPAVLDYLETHFKI